MNTSLRSACLTLMMLLTLAIPLSGSACEDEIKDTIQGEEAELREPDLPNCSRVLTCCANLKSSGVAPESVTEQCTTSFEPTVDTIITSYQDAKSSAEGSEDAVTTVRDTYQTGAEPGCRCFLEETVGQGGDFIPADCMADTTVGTLPANATCEDATDAMFTLASGGGGTQNNSSSGGN